MSDAVRASSSPKYSPDPADEADLRAFDRTATTPMTPEELAEWERTGELPAAVVIRLAACASQT